MMDTKDERFEADAAAEREDPAVRPGESAADTGTPAPGTPAPGGSGTGGPGAGGTGSGGRGAGGTGSGGEGPGGPGTQPEVAEAAGAAKAAEAAAAAAAERLAELETEIGRLKDEHLRALAEVENVRRRAARDKADASRYAVTGFARDLLPVADNLRRALDAVDGEARQQDPALEALVAGVEMTEKSLLGVFERHGITPIAADGERFDPHVHEAMFEIPNESVPHGTVVQVLERGYRIHDRPLRPARVGVSRGGPRPDAAQPAAAAEGTAGEAATNVEPFPAERSEQRAREQTAAYEKDPEREPETSGSRFDEKH